MHATGQSLRLAATAAESDLGAEAQAFLAANPGIETAEIYIVDLHGIARGKRAPAASLSKIATAGVPMPRCLMALDVWGNDVEAAGLAATAGDGDALCRAVPGTLQPVTWAKSPTAQLQLTMHDADGAPFLGDPRQVLAQILGRYARLGLTPVVATELEFYLLEAHSGEHGPMPPPHPTSGRRSCDPYLLSLDELEGFEAVFAAINLAARAQGIPTDTLITEHGAGQFEINLLHQADALRAADHAVMFKRAVKGCARAHGLVATFMAKPFGQMAGSGLHVHMSLLDRQGRNVFDDGALGSPLLNHAVAGLCATMRDFAAIMAPNPNSYRRLRPGAFAPTAPTWGYDNRTVAVRIPQGSGPARRLEHRVAGADANPYLALAAILAGVLHGLEEKLEAPAPSTGCAYTDDPDGALPPTLPEALRLFEGSPIAKAYLGPDLVRYYTACKRQEERRLTGIVPPAEHEAYLRSL
ncbi:MAG: glutamine synthetase family protein [Geminicoccaceae bacterium]